MRVIRTLQIQNIETHRLPLNRKVMRFALDLLVGKIFPPINVEASANGRFKLNGGRHRLAAHKLLGRKVIRAYVGIKQEPYPYKPLVVGENKPIVRDRQKLELTETPKE